MPTLPATYTVEPDADQDVVFRVQETQFGDGYKQTAKDGINTKIRKWSVSFTPLTEAEAAALMAILDAAAGWDLIVWQAPDQAIAENWRCKRYQTIRNAGKVTRIRATLEHVYEP